MSVMYATAEELASYLQQDVDTSSATLALQTASQLFSTRANTMFASTTVTYQVEARGARKLWLPYRPITAVTAVRIINDAGTTVITDYRRIKNMLYRFAGFGTPCAWPPDLLEVDLTHGYATVPDDVKGAVLETAGTAFSNPENSVKSESIDDYAISYATNASGLMLSPSAEKLAELYRGTLAA